MINLISKWGQEELDARRKVTDRYKRGEISKRKYYEILKQDTVRDQNSKKKAQGLLSKIKGVVKTLGARKEKPSEDMEARLRKLKAMTEKINARLKEIDALMKETERKKAALK